MNLPSLLPYVMPEANGLRLQLVRKNDLDSDPKNLSGFFSVMDEPDAVTRLYEATLQTDAGSPVSRLFLLTQKSHYNLGKDALHPLTNMDVELCWQRAFSFYTKSNIDIPVHLFAEQKGKEDILMPFHSLFYCRQKDIYFHPSCPECSQPLTECHDDELLISTGLPSYTSSLERFLFCPSCHDSSEKAVFYVAFNDGQWDPGLVKDQHDLIRAFGNISDSGSPTKSIPCVSCDRHDICFGSDWQAGRNIAPFSFYPFHMLAFDAGSLNALDFLSLLSNVSMSDLSADLATNNTSGRLACVNKMSQQPNAPSFFFKENDTRRFLETLYLKLTFLGEVFTQFFSHIDNPHYPNPELSLNRIWIKLNHRIGLLPFFWNFNVMHFSGILGHDKKSLMDHQKLPFHRLYYLGMAWLHGLLAGRHSNFDDITNAVAESLDMEDISDEKAWYTFLLESYPGLFSPENGYLSSEPLPMDDNSNKLFETALRLGLSLIRAGMGYDPKWSEVTFDIELTKLREVIAQSLFPHIHQPVTSKDSPVLNPDSKIKDILLNIKERILNRPGGGAADLLMDQEVAMETVILTAPDATVVKTQEKDEDEDLDKTVVRRPEETRLKKDLIGDMPEPVEEDEDLSKTVIYRPDQAGVPQEQEKSDISVSEPDNDDISNETVVLGAPPEALSKAPVEVKTDAPKAVDDDDDLDKTVVIREPRPTTPGPAKPEKVPDVDEDLDKTRIIRQDTPEKPAKKNLWGDTVDDTEEDELLDKTVIVRSDKKDK